MGFDTPASQFHKRLYESLRGFLDKEDAIAQRDWRLLVNKLGLSEADKEIVRKAVEKTRTALRLWQHLVGVGKSTGRALVEILKQMERFDVVMEVERFLGETTTTVSDQTRRSFEAIDEAARKGDNKTLKELIGDKTVNYTFLQRKRHWSREYSKRSTVLCRVRKLTKNSRKCTSHRCMQLSTTATLKPSSFSFRKALISTGRGNGAYSSLSEIPQLSRWCCDDGAPADILSPSRLAG